MNEQYLKNVTNGTVWLFTEQLSKRPNFISISKAEYLFRIGKGPEPTDISMLDNVPEDFVNILGKMKDEQMGVLVDFANAIMAGGAVPTALTPPQPQALQPTPVIPEAPLQPPAPPVTTLEPPPVPPEDPPQNNGIPQIKDDPENQIDPDGLSKPPSKMTKGELEVYALATHQIEAGNMTKTELYKKVQEAEAK